MADVVNNGAVNKTTWGVEADKLNVKFNNIDLGVLNTNADMANVNGRLDGIDSDLTTVNGRLDGIDSDMATVNGRLDSVDSDITTVNGRLDGVDSDLTSVNTTVGNIDGRVDELSTNKADKTELQILIERMSIVEGRANGKIRETEGTPIFIFGDDREWENMSGGSVEFQNSTLFKASVSSKLISIAPNYDAKLTKRYNFELKDDDYVTIVFYLENKRTTGDIGIDLLVNPDISAVANRFAKRLYQASLVQGWNFIKLKKSDFILEGTAIWGNFSGIRIRLYPLPNGGGVPSPVIMDSIVINRDITPTILLNFDDSQKSFYELGFPYMQSKGIKGTVHVSNASYNPRYDGDTHQSRLGDTEHHAWLNAGWELGNHSKTHNAVTDLLTEMNYELQLEEINYTHQFLKNKFGVETSVFAMPNGKANIITNEVLNDLGYTTARSSSGGEITGDKGNETLYLPTREIKGSTTVEEIQSWIDKAIEYRTAVSIFTHGTPIDNTDPYSIEYSDFCKVIDYVRLKLDEGEIKVMTFKEFYTAIK